MHIKLISVLAEIHRIGFRMGLGLEMKLSLMSPLVSKVIQFDSFRHRSI